ncbi:hypothetical protein HN859_05725 [Candidatus Parcubacteria bacterium]|nr:hypothetical protein [Candidatus Parcubacteria bacterium]
MTFDSLKGQRIEETEKLLAKKGRKPDFCREQKENFQIARDSLAIFDRSIGSFTIDSHDNFENLKGALENAGTRLKVVRESWSTFLKWGVRDVVMVSENIGVSLNYIKSKSWLRGSVKIGDKVKFDKGDDAETFGYHQQGEWEVLGFNNRGMVIKTKDGEIVNKDIQLLEDEMHLVK